MPVCPFREESPWLLTPQARPAFIVWTLVLLSLALTATTFIPSLTTNQLIEGLAVGAGIGLLGGGFVALRSRNTAKAAAVQAAEAAFAGLAPDQVQELEAAQLSSADRKALLEADRMAWRTPALNTLSRPPFSSLRKAGLLTLRGYLLIAVILVILVIVKVVQMATGH
ncbi:hypothetical protein [Streptacidiphilus sp. EB129]|uniref:hypothetical protein n=1 Tax=Streptacidiphilus sp. EB129 TaxID=3156262 RepID=UPI00351215DB